MDIKTYPEMNERIKDILVLSGLPVDAYAAKRIEELEQEREEHLRIMGQVKAEIEEFMSLLKISFESHPGVVEKARTFNATIRKYREALEWIQYDAPPRWAEKAAKALES
ncbi:hypothetical protein [Brevibacillus centrosporus]|uniref:hypothetical protein n=1 Tax=Brevibacillus centrosporus TaxID=54910 RepID=UPI002E224BF4|nr:hypothetical protein [Brevibacillus centrosporus]